MESGKPSVPRVELLGEYHTPSIWTVQCDGSLKFRLSKWAIVEYHVLPDDWEFVVPENL